VLDIVRQALQRLSEVHYSHEILTRLEEEEKEARKAFPNDTTNNGNGDSVGETLFFNNVVTQQPADDLQRWLDKERDLALGTLLHLIGDGENLKTFVPLIAKELYVEGMPVSEFVKENKTDYLPQVEDAIISLVDGLLEEREKRILKDIMDTLVQHHNHQPK
jgi:hypothetical protein